MDFSNSKDETKTTKEASEDAVAQIRLKQIERKKLENVDPFLDHEAYLLRLFNKSHPTFNYTEVSKKLLPVKIPIHYKDKCIAIFEENIQKALNTDPRFSNIERIFRDDKLREMLEDAVKLNQEDRNRAKSMIENDIPTADYRENIEAQTKVLSCPDAMLNDYWIGEVPTLARLVKQNSSDIDYEIKKYKENDNLFVRLYLVSSSDWYIQRSLFFIKEGGLKDLRVKWEDWNLDLIGIQIGPWRLEFNHSGLIMPYYSGSNYHSVIGVSSDRSGGKVSKSQLPLLCQIITDWNKNRIYSKTPHSDPRFGTSYQFVQEVLDKLGITTNFIKDGPVETYIKNIKYGKMGGHPVIYDPQGKECEVKNMEEYNRNESHIEKDLRLARGTPNYHYVLEVETIYRCVKRLLMLKETFSTGNHFDISSNIFGSYTGKI